MKKFKYYAGLLLIAVAVSVTSCGEDYDDTAIKNDIADLQSRVEKLETWCTTVNGQISALQGLVSALEANNYVTGVSPTATNDGYTITFSKSEAITIHNGKDGAKGADGITPIIGVAKDTDGEYYWTVKTGTAAATWMLDANNKKIRTTGDKGVDGSAGVAGTSPVLSVATDTDGKVYWKVNGEWMLNGGKKVQATGDKGDKGETGSAGAAGADGAQGDAVFAADGVTVDKTKGTVTFTLAGEDGETFTLPMASEMKIFDKFDEFKVNSEKHELTLALNIKDGDYAAIKAELTSSKGMEVTIVKATTRAASTPWGVELTSPTFKEDKTIDVNAKVNFTLPAEIEEGEFALLKVSIVGKDGTEHSATRVIVYTAEVSVESVALTDQSVTKGGTVKLEPIFTPATATNKNVTWTSSKPEVATIAADGTVTGVSIGETTITVTTEDGGFTATCKMTVAEKKSIVGNYYYSDGTYSETLDTNKTCIGIIFEEDTNNAGHGKIVSLDEPVANWNGWNNKEGKLKWSYNKEVGSSVYEETKAYDVYNGFTNMNTVKTFKTNDLTNYPAFAWCDQKKDGNKSWYLPANAELTVIYKQLTMVNAAILNANGTQITGDRYWSSREDSDTFELGVEVSFGTGISNLQYKEEYSKVRAIASF